MAVSLRSEQTYSTWGIVACLVGYGVYKALRLFLRGDQGQLVAVGFASWISTVVAAVSCAGELAWSGTADWRAAFPAMTGVHILTGLGEAAITMLVIAAIGRTRPELLTDVDESTASTGRTTTLVYGALVVIGLFLLVAPHASPMPDGLEMVASSLGFEHKASSSSVISSPLRDYQIPGIQSASTATIVAGAVGALVVFALSFLLARVLVPRRKSEGHSSTPLNRQ